MTQAAEADADPAMAVLSVAYHGDVPESRTPSRLASLPWVPKAGKDHYEWAIRMSPAAARMVLEELVSTTYKKPFSEFGKRHYGEGWADGLLEGERHAVLLVLKARHLEVTDSQRERIAACADLDQLKAWAEAALTATDAGELFG